MTGQVTLAFRRLLPEQYPVLRRIAPWCFTTLGLTFYCQAIIAALQAASGDVARTVNGETNLSSTVTQSFLLLVLILLVVRDPVGYWAAARRVAPMVALAGLALLSTTWSENPLQTLRRAVALGECVLFGLFLYRSLGLDGVIDRLGWLTVALGLLSLAVYVAIPSIGHEKAQGYADAMRGVFPQKNTMTDCMLLGCCCFSYRLIQGGIRLRWLGALAVMTLCLLLGRSASAVLVAVLVFAVALWMRLRGQRVLRAGFLFLLVWGLILLAGVLALAPQDLFALSGRDASLTGRLPLWQALAPEIGSRLLLGHGYAGFWNAASPTVQYIWLLAGWPAPDAHSGYLDVLLQLGVAGLLVLGWVWLRAIATIRRGLRLGIPEARWGVLYATAFLVVSLDEGPLANPNAWNMMLAVLLASLAASRRTVRQPGGSKALIGGRLPSNRST